MDSAAHNSGSNEIDPRSKAFLKGDNEPPQISRRTWLLVLCFRLVLATLLLNSADVPDEWYQSTEVAYHVVHGKGQLTWEWHQGLRSFMFPLPFAVAFKALQLLGMDTAFTYWLVPKLMAGAVAFCIDHAAYSYAKTLFGPEVAFYTLCMTLTSWWHAFLATRTQSNIIETLALLVALQQKDFFRFLLASGLGCSLRITFVVPVLLPALNFFRAAYEQGRIFRYGLLTIIMIGGWIAFIAAVDYLFYGRWLCTPWEFVRFNVIEGHSALFGSHPWHWYVSQAIPSTLGAQTFLTPLAALWITRCRRGDADAEVLEGASISPKEFRSRLHSVLAIIAFTTLGYSMVSHKELRFVFTILPLILMVIAMPLALERRVRPWRKHIVTAMAAGGIIMFVLFAQLFQRGTIEVMTYLRSLPEPARSVHVMMGCHSTPGYSYVHGQVEELVHNNCDTGLRPDGTGRITTEHHMFYEDVVAFAGWVYHGERPANDTVRGRELNLMIDELPTLQGYQGRRSLPQRFILFTKDAEKLRPMLLEPHGFVLERRFYHTFYRLMDEMDFTIDVWRRDVEKAMGDT